MKDNTDFVPNLSCAGLSFFREDEDETGEGTGANPLLLGRSAGVLTAAGGDAEWSSILHK